MSAQDATDVLLARIAEKRARDALVPALGDGPDDGPTDPDIPCPEDPRPTTPHRHYDSTPDTERFDDGPVPDPGASGTRSTRNPVDHLTAGHLGHIGELLTGHGATLLRIAAGVEAVAGLLRAAGIYARWMAIVGGAVVGTTGCAAFVAGVLWVLLG